MIQETNTDFATSPIGKLHNFPRFSENRFHVFQHSQQI